MKEWRSLTLVALACAILFPAGAAAQQLTITSPSAGTVVAPGQTLVVTVSVTSGSVLAVLVSAQDIGATPLQTTVPYSFSLTIPQDIVGLKSLTAFGFTAPEQAATSAPESIQDEVRQFRAAGKIKNQGIANSWLVRLGNAAQAWVAGDCPTAISIYQTFINRVNAQSGKGVDADAAQILIADAQYLMAHCP